MPEMRELRNKILGGLVTLLGAIGATTAIYRNVEEPLKWIIFSFFFGVAMIGLGLTIGFFFNSNNYPVINKKRGRIKINEFLRNRLDIVVKSNIPIKIDAMGVKLKSLVDFLEDYKNQMAGWGSTDVRFLALNSKSIGAKHREILENRPVGELQKLEEQIKVNVETFRRLIRDSKSTINFQPKLYDIDPAYYIIRINDSMFVGFFVAEKGPQSPYTIIDKNKAPELYMNFLNYFEIIYNNSSITKKI